MAKAKTRVLLIRRSKDNLNVQFGLRARRLGTHALGNLQAILQSGRIHIKDIEESDRRGTDFYIVRNTRCNRWFQKNWRKNRTLVQTLRRVGGHTSPSSVETALNKLLGYTEDKIAADAAASGLSSIGGTSVVNYQMEQVTYMLEDATDATDEETDFLLNEDNSGGKFVGEDKESVLTMSDGTYLSVDTRAVSHGGGSAGNPVTSGAVSGTDLVLTLQDSSTVTIDATTLKNLDTSVSIASPNWYQTYANPGQGSADAGAQINTLSPTSTNSPFNFGQTLARGYEFVWSLSYGEESNYIGIWNGTTTYNTTQTGKAVYWHKHLRYSSSNDQIRHGTNAYDSVGWDLSDDYTTIHGTTKLALRYDYGTNKLQLWDDTDDYRALICTASVAEDGNPVTISCGLAADAALPNFQTTRETEWNIIAQVNAGADTTWRDGSLTDTVIKHTRGLHPGEKMVTTTPAAWLAHYLTFDYTGTATGQTGVEMKNSGSLQVTSGEALKEKHGDNGTGFTINALATRFSSGDITVAMGGAKISFRYHMDNSFDLYDEDNEEVLFTKDADFDGSTQFLHIAFSSTVNQPSNIIGIANSWDFEPFTDRWFYHPASKYKPGQLFTPITFDGSSRWIWGEYMYPGQEFVFTETQTASGNTYIGVRNDTDTTWVRWIGLDGTNISATNEGFDISSAYNVAGKVIAMRYDYGDNKLKWYDLNTTGVETLITTASVACDGNKIRISASGNNKAPQSPVLRYYGWEYKHTPTAYPQPWKNWRLNRPTSNAEIKIDTVLKSRRALLPGYYMRWTTSTTSPNFFVGQWKSSNAASGVANVEATDNLWDWGFKGNNSERFRNYIGFTPNASNPNYVANSGDPYWADPAAGTTQVQIRYHATSNKIDLHDHTNNQIIATKDANGDGNGIYISWGTGHNIAGTAGVTDDFLGGGDVEIATSNFSPTFTGATNMNYGDDGILAAGEMVKIDTAVAVGKRMIIYPEFWGLLEDMGGVASSGPAVDGTGWVDTDAVVIGWQKASSPHVGTNIGSNNSGWDAAMYMLLRGAGTNHASRIALYSPGNAAFTDRDGRVMSHYFTDLYYTFDRIANNSGRIQAFSTLALARTGVTGGSQQWYGNGTDTYFDGNAQALTLTGDNYLYIYSITGNFTLPTTTTDCVEILTIPT